MRYYIIVGEASGDLHASNLMKELKTADTEADFRFWGGNRMMQQGGVLVKHITELAFMGFVEVLKNIRTIFKNISFCKHDIIKYKPHALILIDYPGFNLRIARFAKKHNIPVYYYISPQVWAWNESRVKLIKRVVHRMYVILPFEKDFYARHNFDVHFVGHPLCDAIKNNTEWLNRAQLNEKYNLNQKPIIALLPGSRLQEIEKMLSVMLTVVKELHNYQFVVCAVNTLDLNVYKNKCSPYNVQIIVNDTYNVLNNAYAALVTSGTATLETALFNVPQVVCYNANYVSYIIAKNLIKLKFISLVNLIMNKQSVVELIQKDLNAKKLKKELEHITENDEIRSKVLSDYKELFDKLGGPGASQKTADDIYNDLLKIN